MSAYPLRSLGSIAWEPRTYRGRGAVGRARSGTTRSSKLSFGLVADRRLEDVSMRAIATELKVPVMTLYNHVQGSARRLRRRSRPPAGGGPRARGGLARADPGARTRCPACAGSASRDLAPQRCPPDRGDAPRQRPRVDILTSSGSSQTTPPAASPFCTPSCWARSRSTPSSMRGTVRVNRHSRASQAMHARRSTTSSSTASMSC